MRFLKMTGVAIMFVAPLPATAGAAVLLSHSGIVGDGSFFNAPGVSIVEHPTYEPGEATSQIHFALDVINNYTVLREAHATSLPQEMYFAPRNFVLTLTLPSAPVSAAGGISQLFWGDFYFGTPGSLFQSGGYDNLGYQANWYGYAPLPIAINGQSAIFSFTSQLFYSLGNTYNSEYSADFSWAGPAFMNVTFRNEDYGLPYQVTLAEVSGVPEPSTWAMLLIGFGAVGFMLRRSRRTRAPLAL